MDEICFSRRTLIKYYTDCPRTGSRYNNFLEKVKHAIRKDLTVDIKQILSKLIYDYKSKMKASRYNVPQFNRKYKEWADAYVMFLVESTRTDSSSDIKCGGRPSINFDECSDR